MGINLSAAEVYFRKNIYMENTLFELIYQNLQNIKEIYRFFSSYNTEKK